MTTSVKALFQKVLYFLGMSITLLFVASVVAIIAFYQTFIPQNAIKEVAEHVLKKQLNGSVQIGMISGDLFKNIVAENVQCQQIDDDGKPVLFTIKKIHIQYHLWTALSQENGLVKSIKKINISEADMHVRRNKEGQFYLSSFKQKGSFKMQHFNPIINIANSNVHFNDARGLMKSKKFQYPFDISIKNINASIQKDPSQNLVLLGSAELQNQIFDMQASLNTTQQLAFKLKNVNLSAFDPYFLPFPSYNTFKGVHNLEGAIFIKSINEKKFLGFDIYTDFEQLNLELPFFNQHFLNTKGRVSISNHRIHYQDLKRHFGKKKAKRFYRQLKKQKLLDDNNRLTAAFFSSKTNLNKDLLNWLSAPKLVLGLHHIQSDLAGIAVKSDGYINILSPYIYLNNNTNTMQLHTLKRLFPTIETLNYEGEGTIRFYAKGKLTEPRLFGTCNVKKGKILDIKCKDINLAYNIRNKYLNFTVRKGRLLQTSVTGNGKISLIKNNFNLKLHNRLDIDNYMPGIYGELIAGDVAMMTDIIGDGKTLQLESSLIPVSQTQILNQKVNRVSLNATFSPYSNLRYANINAYLNNEQDLLQAQAISYTKDILSLNIKTPSTNSQIFSNIVARIDMKDSWVKNLKEKNIYQGFLKLNNIQFKQLNIDNVLLKGGFENHVFNIEKLNLQQDKTSLKVSGNMTTKKDFQLYFHDGSEIVVNSDDGFWAQFGIKQGRFKINGQLSGKEKQIMSHLEVKGKKIKSNIVNMDTFYGNIIYKNQELSIPRFTINYMGNTYEADLLCKNIPLDFFYNKAAFDHLEYELNLRIEDGKLDSIFDVFNQANQELRNKKWFSPVQVFKQQSGKKTPFHTFRLKDPHHKTQKWVLFSQNKAHSLNFFAGLDHVDKNQKNAINLKDTIEGYVNANLQIRSSKKGLPKINGQIFIAKGQFKNMSAHKLYLDLESAQDYLLISTHLQDGKISGKSFNEFKLESKLSKNNIFHIEKSSIQTRSFKSNNPILGRITLSQEGFKQSAFDLNIKLSENEINLLSYVFPSIEYLKNEGSLDLKIKKNKGSDQLGIIQGKIVFKNFMGMTTNLDDALFEIKDSVLEISSDNILIDHLPILYTKVKQKVSDTILFNVSGKASLSLVEHQADGFYIRSDLDLALAPLKQQHLSLDTYNGLFSAENMRLTGLYQFPISEKSKVSQHARINNNQETGPILSGDITLEKGIIYAPVNTEASVFPELHYNLSVNLGKSLFFEGDFLGEGVLSGLSIDLECKESLNPLQVMGTMNNPIIENKVFLEKGYLVILNTEFELLAHKQQQAYVGQTGTEYAENYLTFSQVRHKNGTFLEPHLQLRSLAVIENSVVSQNMETEIQVETQEEIQSQSYSYKHILMDIKGPLSNLDVFQFDSFSSESGQVAPSQLVYEESFNIKGDQDNENQSALLSLLLPGVSFLEDQSVGQSEFLHEFGKQRINLFFRRSIRPVEQKLAKTIGVDYLSVDYNVSQALFSDVDKSIGINLKKKLSSDKLYLNLKTRYLYDNAPENVEKFSVSEAELNYYVLKNLSLNMGTIKQNDIREYQAKFSLRFSHAF